MSRPDGMEGVIAAHAPVLGVFAKRWAIVGCTCLSAHDYRVAGFRAGQLGWTAHLADALRAAGFGLVGEANPYRANEATR